MAVSKAVFPSVESVTSTDTASCSLQLSSASAFRTSSVQFAQLRPSVNSKVRRLVSTRANLPLGEHSIRRRDVLANLLGAGAALGFSEQALAANPGSLARQRKVRKPESKREKRKPEEVKSVIESTSLNPSPPPQVPKASVEPKLPEVSSFSEPIITTEVPSVSEVPSIPEPPIVQEVPSPVLEPPAPQAEPSNSDDCNIGDYFKDLF